MIGKVKLTIVVFVGGASEMETLNNASPFTTQFVVHRLCTPLQEESDRLAANTAKTRYFLELMQHPTTDLGATCGGDARLEFPTNTLTQSLVRDAGKTQNCPNINGEVRCQRRPCRSSSTVTC